MTKRIPYLNLMTFYTVYLFLGSFSTSILPTYFLKNGLSLNQIMLGKIIYFIGQLILLLGLKNLKAKFSWKMALVTSIAYILLIINLNSALLYYLGVFINGMSLFFFFLFYNIAHFELTPKEKTGNSSALMFIVPSFIGILAPLLAGFLAQINIYFVWLFSLFLFFLSYLLLNKQKDFRVTYSIREAWSEIKATRIFLILEGVWEALPFGIIPIYTLFFIKEPLPFGTYLSYLALISIVANFILGKLSDKLKKRVVFLYPITILISVVTFLLPLATSRLVIWIVLTGILKFLLPVFSNVSTAFVVDTHSNLRKAIPGREIALAVGRFTGLFLSFLSFTFEQRPRIIFFVLGLFMLSYTLVLFVRTKIMKTYNYL